MLGMLYIHFFIQQSIICISLFSCEQPHPNMSFYNSLVFKINESLHAFELVHNILLVFQNVWFACKHAGTWFILWNYIYNTKSPTSLKESTCFTKNSVSSQLWDFMKAIPVSKTSAKSSYCENHKTIYT